jgi:hypothetical protein
MGGMRGVAHGHSFGGGRDGLWQACLPSAPSCLRREFLHPPTRTRPLPSHDHTLESVIVPTASSHGGCRDDPGSKSPGLAFRVTRGAEDAAQLLVEPAAT